MHRGRRAFRAGPRRLPRASPPLRSARPPRALAALAVLAPAFWACGDEADRATPPARPDEAGVGFRLETVAEGLEVPWSLAFVPDGRIFVTERPGRVRVIDADGLRAEPWAELAVAATGEAGLMGIAASPDFERTGHVYVVGTFATDDGLVDRVVRLTDRAGVGVDPVVVVDGLPANRFHAGAALAFGPDGMLYVTTGDARDPPAAQDLSSRAGKILRYRPDGGIPADNPFPGSPVYALGLRNVQGLAWHSATGHLFATDHGPSGFPDEDFRRGEDELNVIVPRGNYGWPEAAGMEDRPRFLPPIAAWTPAIAPSGLAIHSGHEFPAWSGDAFIGALRGRHLRRLDLEPAPGTTTGWRVLNQAALLEDDLGRIRLVASGPDGRLYIGTSNRDGRGDPAPADDRLFRVVPR